MMPQNLTVMSYIMNHPSRLQRKMKLFGLLRMKISNNKTPGTWLGVPGLDMEELTNLYPLAPSPLYGFPRYSLLVRHLRDDIRDLLLLAVFYHNVHYLDHC